MNTSLIPADLSPRAEAIGLLVEELLASPDVAAVRESIAASYGEIGDPLGRAKCRAVLLGIGAAGPAAELARGDLEQGLQPACCVNGDMANLVAALEGSEDAADRIAGIVRSVVQHDLDVDAEAMLGGLAENVLGKVLADLQRFAEEGGRDAFHRFRAYMILFGVYHQDPPEEGGTIFIRTAAAPDNARAERFRERATEAYVGGIEAGLNAALREKGIETASGLDDYSLRIPDELRAGVLVSKTGVRIELDSSVGNDHVLVSQDIGAQIIHVSILLRDEESGEYDYPIRIRVSRIDEPVLRLSSIDKEVPPRDVTTMEDLFDISASGANEWVRLSKAGAIAAGIVPYHFRNDPSMRLDQVLTRLGGGLEIVTEVKCVPVGSGTGTSSAIAAAIVAGLVKITGQTGSTGLEMTDEEKMLVVARVLLVEQLIGALGGWQDPCAIFPGIKLLETDPGDFLPRWRPMDVPEQGVRDLTSSLKLTDGAYRQPSEAAAWQFTGLWVMRLADVYEARMSTRRLVKQQIAHLASGDIRAMGPVESADWINRTHISPKATNPYIERVVELVREALGEGNVDFDACGARGGAGGCYWIDPDRTSEEEFAEAFFAASKTAMAEYKDSIRFGGEPRIYDYAINPTGLELSMA